ncbi:DMT family transporter [Ciceribacter sp. L1K22]|uniref:DMT family transporter n=1 Tax=Ciceribacter sp. L1K22 TaxID=2820275 RepID=UPI001ABED647|nr:DMT family transporter [Ciceribacter sp. L1K22]MBO3761238.1 DMT family transporter [Ciceribacter sp. L1K22]
MADLTERAASPNSHVIHATGREKLLAHGAMLLFAALIAGSFSFGGIAAQSMEAGPLTLWRYLLTVVVMGVMAFGIFKAPLVLPKQPWRFAILGGLIAFYMLTMFTALEFTSPVQTGAVFTLMPLLSAGFALVLIRQPTRPGVLAALVIAALGAVWVIFRADLQAILSFDVGTGEIIYFFGVIAHAAYVPLIRKFGRGENPVAFGFWVTVYSIPWLLPTGLLPLVRTDFSALPISVWATVAYLSIVTTAVTFMLLQYASTRLPAAKVLGYGYLTPTTVIILEGMIGHGWASPAVFMGALVTAGGLLVMGLLRD